MASSAIIPIPTQKSTVDHAGTEVTVVIDRLSAEDSADVRLTPAADFSADPTARL